MNKKLRGTTNKILILMGTICAILGLIGIGNFLFFITIYNHSANLSLDVGIFLFIVGMILILTSIIMKKIIYINTQKKKRRKARGKYLKSLEQLNNGIATQVKAASTNPHLK